MARTFVHSLLYVPFAIVPETFKVLPWSFEQDAKRNTTDNTVAKNVIFFIIVWGVC
jgi:hypothetical protein